MIKWIGKLGRQVVDGYTGDGDTEAREELVNLIAFEFKDSLINSGCDELIADAFATGMIISSKHLSDYDGMKEASMEDLDVWSENLIKECKEVAPDWFGAGL